MRICVITERSHIHGVGGRELNSYALCKGLADRGHDCTVLTKSPGGHSRTLPVTKDNVLVHCVPRESDGGSWTQSLLREFGRLHTHMRFDVVHLHDLSGILFCRTHAFRQHRVPVVMSCHGTHLDWIRSNLLTLCYVWRARDIWHYVTDLLTDACFLLRRRGLIGRTVNVCVAFDRASAALAKLQYGLATDRIATIHNGVDTELFKPRHRGSTHADHAIPQHRRLILFAGRLVVEKGPQFLVAALPRILSRHHDAHLLVVGAGPLRERLINQAEHHGLRERVTLTGALSRERLAVCISDAAVIVNPILHYGSYNTVVLEAMACARPLILTRKGGLDKFLADGHNCLLVRPGSIVDVVETVCTALAEPGRMAQIGRNARDLVLEEFTLGQMVSETLDLYRSLLGERRPADSNIATRTIQT